jgi:hypothetical protein
LGSALEQLVVLLLPSQLMGPDAQFTEAVQSAFPCMPVDGRFAAGTGAGAAREARKLLSVGAPCGRLAAIAGDMQKPRAIRIIETPRTIFFMTISFLERSSIRGNRHAMLNIALSSMNGDDRMERRPGWRARTAERGHPQVQVPAQGLWFWQLKTTLSLPQNVLQALRRSGQVAHLSAAAGAGNKVGRIRRAKASASLVKVFFMPSSPLRR